MSALSEYFLKSRSTVVLIETIEILHSSISPIRVTRNKPSGVAVYINSSWVSFSYYPMKVSFDGIRDNLQSGIKIDLGDLGSFIPSQLDLIRGDDAMITCPDLYYRAYRSDDLFNPVYGPFRYLVTSITNNQDGASITAKAPETNVNRTGEIYSINRFPMLRGFL